MYLYFLQTKMFTISLCKKGLSIGIKIVARTYTSYQNPFTRTWNIISNDIRRKKVVIYPNHADIVIIGGGYIGSSVAYWLKNRAGPGLSVVVLDKDENLKQPQNNEFLGMLSQHYSLPENIQLSQYSTDFFRNVKEHLSGDVDIQYYPYGRLILASEKYAEQLEKNVAILRELGTKNEILTTDVIHSRYPWIDTTDVKLGCISTESEGVFNSAEFLKALIKKSEDLGATYLNAEAVGFELEQQRDILMEGMEPGTFQKIRSLKYKTPDNDVHSLEFAVCIIAAGDESGNIAKMANIGVGKGLLTIPLPIEKREYSVYSIDNSSNTIPVGLNTPSIIDTSGVWFRRNQLKSNLLCGHTPMFATGKNKAPEDEFGTLIQPALVNRFPECKNMKINKLKTEVCDYNTYDDTGILGPHAYHGTLLFATGFGVQGCQHAPGIGRAIAELIIDGHFTTIDLTRFGFDRLLTDYPLIESNAY